MKESWNAVIASVYTYQGLKTNYNDRFLRFYKKLKGNISFSLGKEMITFIIFLGLIVLGKSQLIYPDQYEYLKTSTYPAYANSQQRSYPAVVAYAEPAAGAAPVAYYAAGAAPVAYSAPAAAPAAYSAAAPGTYSVAAPAAYSAAVAATPMAYYASGAAPVAYYASGAAPVAYYASGAAPMAYYAAAPAYYSSPASIVNQLSGQPIGDSLSQAASQINVNTIAAPISPLAQSLPLDWAYRVNDIISKGVTKLALNIQNVLYANNLASVKNEKDNIVFSPLNIAGSLALIHLGSAGITFEEVSRILGLAMGVDISTHSELVHQIFGLLISVVHEKAESTRIIDIASAIFLQEGFPIRPEFKTISENVYQSVVMNLDFQERGKEAQDKINAWVKENTNGKISTILNDIPSPATKVIIASTLYFNAEWNRYFIMGATGRKKFSIEPNEQILVDMMYNAGDFPFYEDKNYGVKIVGLPYKGLDTTMYIMLPKAEGARALGEFERTLTPEIIEYLIQNMKNQTTILGMPKMKITSSLKLKKVLESLGLTSLFNPATADLSLLSPSSRELIANATQNPTTKSSKSFNDQNRQLNNRDQLVFSRFGGDSDGGQVYKKHLFKYTDNTRRYNIEQWATGFNIRRMQRKRREIETELIDDENNVKRVRRQSRPMSEDFLRIVENRNFRSYGLDDLRNSATLANPGLYADEVLHKVDIEINEKGTEAAAATTIVLERDGRQKRLLANRPFLFFIRHNPTKLILFWGTINTPTPNFSNM
ncbi:serine protease inhibitor 28Dc isoform X1 [Vespa crabro]|uniref:serine protease inhibitor 28Dc isoform X1 n=2 Tax=Vespa crabro TaxID=7445 RepID=UPI001F01932D|nr:serine protease inhibitor 28Dc isoform X1 [Vespa crabro]